MHKRWIEFTVGLFLLGAIIALLVLSYKVSDLSNFTSQDVYYIRADFDNIGGLKPRAPVSIAGVRIGEVMDINLDIRTYKAIVTMKILKQHDKIPNDSTASILTAGLLGANYISISPGFGEEDDEMLDNGGRIEETHSAIILENLIGKLLFNINSKGKSSDNPKTEE